MCVLLVEDDDTLGKLFLRHLRQLGYTGDLAVSAEDAMRLVQEKTYGLIIMDISLPGQDGLQATSAIRQMPKFSTSSVPIVALTAGHANRLTCMEAGMDDWFQKPVLLDGLRKILEKWSPTRCQTQTQAPAQA